MVDGLNFRQAVLSNWQALSIFYLHVPDVALKCLIQLHHKTPKISYMHYFSFIFLGCTTNTNQRLRLPKDKVNVLKNDRCVSKSVFKLVPTLLQQTQDKHMLCIIQYPITQLLHLYLHRSNGTAPLKYKSLLLPCSTYKYTATLLEYLYGYSKVTVELLQRSSTTTSV